MRSRARRFCNVWDSLARVCMPRRLRFDEDAGSDDLTERGHLLLRDELVRHHSGVLLLFCTPAAVCSIPMQSRSPGA